MSQYSSKLSLWERVDLTFRMLTIAAFYLARGLPSAKARGMSLKFVALSLFFRLGLGALNPRYLQSIAPSTAGRYKRWITAKQKRLAVDNPEMTGRLREDIESIPGTDASIVWVGDRKKASKFVVFFHGGGYIVAATGGHFEWCWNSYVAGGPGEKDEVAVAVIQYTLCPPARYPEQLRQVCAGLAMLLKRGIPSSHIIFGGDSAGGNLTGQVIRHLVEPHPGIQPIKLEGPIAGAFMVSPLVDSRTDTRSFRDNNAVDMISSYLSQQTSDEMFRPTTDGMRIEQVRALALPLEGDPAWMAHISSVVKALYITGGKQESFSDQIRQFAELVRRQCDDLIVRFEAPEREGHDYIILEGIFGEGFDATRRMQAWASKIL